MHKIALINIPAAIMELEASVETFLILRFIASFAQTQNQCRKAGQSAF